MHLKRILLSTATCLMLSSCGGGSGEMLLSEGGIGGSGFSVGSITAFGSIWVNGVRYDVSEASFIRDGVTASGQSDYQIGEVVTIKGVINADGVSGIAESVEFNDALEGTVTALSTDGSSIEVLGNMINTDASTVFHGFDLLSDLQLGNVLEISGSHDAQGVIKASSITLKQQVFTGESKLEVEGVVSELDQSAKTFRLGQLLIDYSTAELELPNNTPVNGQYVEVESDQAPQGNLIIASEVEQEDGLPDLESGQELELEGFVTSFTSIQQFSVSGLMVMTDDATEVDGGVMSDIQLNSFIEVEGYINEQGVLIADEVSIKSSTDESEEEHDEEDEIDD